MKLAAYRVTESSFYAAGNLSRPISVESGANLVRQPLTTAHVSESLDVVIDGLHSSSLYQRQLCTSELTVSTSMTSLVCVYSLIVVLTAEV